MYGRSCATSHDGRCGTRSSTAADHDLSVDDILMDDLSYVYEVCAAGTAVSFAARYVAIGYIRPHFPPVLQKGFI